MTFIVSPCIFVHLVLSPTYALIYIIEILSQAITLVALFTPTLVYLMCFVANFKLSFV